MSPLPSLDSLVAGLLFWCCFGVVLVLFWCCFGVVVGVVGVVDVACVVGVGVSLLLFCDFGVSLLYT